MLNRRLFAFSTLSLPFSFLSFKEKTQKIDRHPRIEAQWIEDLSQWTISCPDLDFGVVNKHLYETGKLNSGIDSFTNAVFDKLGHNIHFYWDVHTVLNEDKLKDGMWYSLGWFTKKSC